MATDLKQQLLALQEQKKQKLVRRNELHNKTVAKNSKFTAEGGLNENDLAAPVFDDVDDDLDLMMKEAADLGGGLMVDSETDMFKEAIRELKDENGRLHKLLGEKNEEMKIFKRRWEKEKKDLTGQDIGSENVAQKIIELSRKNRAFSVEVESSKTKNRQLQSEIQRLENEVKKLSTNPKFQNQVGSQKKKDTNDNNKVAELEGKISSLNNKVSEYRNQLDSHKKELKIAHKVLSNEIGEDINMQSLLNGEISWRGRQQQIVSLQNKVAALQKKLAVTARPSSRSSSVSVLANGSYQSPLSASMHDERVRSTIKRIEQDRKENQQKLQTELDNLQKEHTRVTGKYDAAKSRNQVLSQELKSLKTQMGTLIEKGKHDDDLVSALMREQEYLKQLNSKLSKEKEELESHSSSRTVKANQESEMNNELKRQIEIQEKKVKSLEDELDSLKRLKSHEKEVARSEEKADDGMIDSQRNQVNRSSTRSLIPTPPTSGDRRMAGYTKRYRRNISASSDTNSTKIQFQETKSMLQAVEVERDRLIELVELLQKRVDSATEECIACENKVIEMRRTNAKLEKQVERLKSVGNAKIQTSRNRPVSRGSKKINKERTVDELYEEVENLQAMLEIQKDENDALKEALDSTLKAKDEDMKIYQEMVEQTKFIYLQGLKQIKQTSSSQS